MLSPFSLFPARCGIKPIDNRMSAGISSWVSVGGGFAVCLGRSYKWDTTTQVHLVVDIDFTVIRASAGSGAYEREPLHAKLTKQTKNPRYDYLAGVFLGDQTYEKELHVAFTKR